MFHKISNYVVTCTVVLLLSRIAPAGGLYVVNSSADTGAGSLRDGIAALNASLANDIQFDPSLTNATITLGSSLPNLNAAGAVTIDGAGAPGLTVSGNALYRILFIDGGNVTIRNLRLAQGLAKGATVVLAPDRAAAGRLGLGALYIRMRETWWC